MTKKVKQLKVKVCEEIISLSASFPFHCHCHHRHHRHHQNHHYQNHFFATIYDSDGANGGGPEFFERQNSTGAPEIFDRQNSLGESEDIIRERVRVIFLLLFT